MKTVVFVDELLLVNFAAAAALLLGAGTADPFSPKALRATMGAVFRCPVWSCSVETLAALGVKNIIAVGMFGAFSADVQPGEIVVPRKAFVEEGTSLHYYESIEAAQPDPTLHRLLMDTLQKRDLSIVSTDAVYRQTFRKEQLWRERGAVGVDMETSAVFSVSQYLGLRAAALLMASDLHPSSPDAPKWQWLMTADMRYDLTEQALAAAKAVCYEGD